MKKIYGKEKIYCHSCGRRIAQEHGILQEDVLTVKKDWGYFSKKDLQVHEFVICEDCYDKMIAGFAKPVEISEKKEALN